MDTIDKHWVSLLKGNKEDNTVTIKLHINEVSSILNCLHFAQGAASIVMEAELKKGTTQGVRKMQAIKRDAKELAIILEKHFKIGQPESDEIN
jgi:hypothetical protein